MLDKSLPPFCFIAGKLPADLALNASDPSSPDNWIAALEYYKKIDEGFAHQALLNSGNSDLHAICRAAEKIQCERLSAAENLLRLELLHERLHYFQNITVNHFTGRALQAHKKQIEEIQFEASTVFNCLVKNCTYLEIETIEMSNAAEALSIEFLENLKTVMKQSSKLIDKMVEKG